MHYGEQQYEQQQQYNPHVPEHDPHHGYQQVQQYIPQQHYTNMMPAQNSGITKHHTLLKQCLIGFLLLSVQRRAQL